MPASKPSKNWLKTNPHQKCQFVCCLSSTAQAMQVYFFQRQPPFLLFDWQLIGMSFLVWRLVSSWFRTLQKHQKKCGGIHVNLYVLYSLRMFTWLFGHYGINILSKARDYIDVICRVVKPKAMWLASLCGRLDLISIIRATRSLSEHLHVDW